MPALNGARRRRAPRSVREAVGIASVVILMLLGTRFGFAQSVGVPAELQAEVLSRLVVHDRNFNSRAAGAVRVLLVVRPNSKSNLAAATMKSALGELDLLGNLSHREIVVRYESAVALATLCRQERATIVYITPGFDDQIDALREALAGVDVLSVAAAPEYVPRGIVLGFELLSGKPKLVLNLNQAKQQNVNFKADVLKLMKVYR